MNESSVPVHRIEVLVAPVIVFVVVCALLAVARNYESLPAQAPDCGFKTYYGIPCVGCGGTRSMKALSNGHFSKAIRMNPLVVIGVLVSICWLAFAIWRFRAAGAPLSPRDQNRRIKLVALITLCLLALNWIYLVLFLK